MGFRLPRDLHDIHAILSGAGYGCHLVGGAVRSLVLGRKPKDWDLATDAGPEEVQRLFRRVIPTGIRHGTVTILFRGSTYEITTYRIEKGYSDGRRPDAVEYTPSLEEDLKRRDFTINAMAVEIGSGELVDPHGGRLDCARGIVRAIGNPEERFREDGLRLLRAVRFAVTLDFSIEPETSGAMKSCADGILRISPERIQMELEEILRARTPSRAFSLMAETGLLERILPELSAGVGVTQKGRHRFDVFTHSIMACDGIRAPDPGLRLAALFHDIGKPFVASRDEEGVRIFHGHEEKSAELASAILGRLRFPSGTIKRVVHLVREHMFSYDPSWTDAAVRRFLIRVGEENWEDLFLLRLADGYACRGEWPDPRSLDGFRGRILKVLAEKDALSLKSLKIGGRDLTALCDIPPGPAMGRVLEFLLEAVVDDPALNEKETLAEMARRYYKSRLSPS